MLSLHCTRRIVLGTVFVLFAMAAQLPLRAAQVDINTPIPNDTPLLTVANVNTIIAQAVAYLLSVKKSGLISVADREGHILAIYRMNPPGSVDPRINEQATVKARTASFFESEGEAFTSRTAQFIIQSNFPPGVRNVDAGPLFGVEFSNFTNDDVQLQQPPAIVFVNKVNAPGVLAEPVGTSNTRPLAQPLVITPLTDDPGGFPLYDPVTKKPIGSVGVEIDGFGVLANGVPDAGVERTNTGITPEPSQQLFEEAASLAAAAGFDPPAGVRANKVVVNGFRFPYVKAKTPSPKKYPPVAVAMLPALGKFEPYFDTAGTEDDPTGAGLVNPYTTTYNPFAVTLMAPRGTPTQEFPKQGWVGRFPPRDSPIASGLTKADVMTMVQQAADQANLTRGAIRLPIGAAARVWVSAVDTQGNICGVYRTNDATIFSFDIAVQKARTAAFFSTNTVGITTRALGFMSQTFYPPGVEAHPPGPMSGLLPNAGGNAGDLGLDPTGTDAANLTEISQLLTDDGTNTLVSLLFSLPPGPDPAFTKLLTRNAVQLLARRIPHIRDGRLSPLQASITVDVTLRGTVTNPGYDPAFPPPASPLLPNGICIFPGGVPIYKNGILVGGLGVSGDGVDQDDYICFNGARGYQPPDGVRCDEVDEGPVKTALLAAVPKLKAEFPTLTNGQPVSATTSPAVIDVLLDRLTNGPILEGLRLPYVKFPRSPNR